MTTVIRARRWLVISSLVFLGCGSSGPTAEETIVRFLRAVQDQDLERLYCLMAGASRSAELGADPRERRANFEAWVLGRYDAYLEGRDAGWIDLDEQGLALVKLFGLGQGAYFSQSEGRSLGPDHRLIENEVRLGYAQADLSGLAPGTTFYVAGSPIGRIHAVRVPERSEEMMTMQVLESVRIRWTLVRSEPAPDCPRSWMLASAEPIEGSDASTEITWTF